VFLRPVCVALRPSVADELPGQGADAPYLLFVHGSASQGRDFSHAALFFFGKVERWPFFRRKRLMFKEKIRVKSSGKVWKG
jgi:hypothetical protein